MVCIGEVHLCGYSNCECETIEGIVGVTVISVDELTHLLTSLWAMHNSRCLPNDFGQVSFPKWIFVSKKDGIDLWFLTGRRHRGGAEVIAGTLGEVDDLSLVYGYLHPVDRGSSYLLSSPLWMWGLFWLVLSSPLSSSEVLFFVAQTF
eukprot:GHVN01010041.1.p1 GENE.GHVN01010041.1~~GHVN01010041.1.p1  ORF type:complete len:148 (-),score=7.57 GHVN01010041.1:159-602(-)